MLGGSYAANAPETDPEKIEYFPPSCAPRQCAQVYLNTKARLMTMREERQGDATAATAMALGKGRVARGVLCCGVTCFSTSVSRQRV
jgi:hypothetical protein